MTQTIEDIPTLRNKRFSATWVTHPFIQSIYFLQSLGKMISTFRPELKRISSSIFHRLFFKILRCSDNEYFSKLRNNKDVKMPVNLYYYG